MVIIFPFFPLKTLRYLLFFHIRLEIPVLVASGAMMQVLKKVVVENNKKKY